MAKEKKEIKVPTSVNILWEGILLLPIFGAIDSERAREMLETMLKKISDTQSKGIILDILGVPIVDTPVAGYLIQMTKAIKLMGCKCIISGISPEVAQTMVRSGVDLGDVITKATLRDALEFSFEKLGLEVRKIKEVSKKRG